MRVCNSIVTNLTMYRHETTRDDVDTASMRRHETLCRKVFCDDCDAPPTRPAGDGGAPLDVHRSGLTHATLTNATLLGTNLTDANLTLADLGGAALNVTNLNGTNLRGANLLGAVLTGVFCNATTQWPLGFTPPTCR